MYDTKRYVRACVRVCVRARECVRARVSVGSGGYRLRQIIGISLTGRILLVRDSGIGNGGGGARGASEKVSPARRRPPPRSRGGGDASSRLSLSRVPTPNFRSRYRAPALGLSPRP